MGKIEFIPQPYASKLCAGVLRLVHSDAQLEKFDCVYIYADEQVLNSERSIEQIQMLRNQQLFGVLPNLLPTKAVIGYVVVSCLIKFEGNNLMRHGFLYEVNEAYVFDKPIYVSKEQALILAEADSFEEIPSHFILPTLIDGDNGILSFPVSTEVFSSLNEGSEIKLEVSHDVMNAIFNEDGNMKDFSGFQIYTGNRVKRFEWSDRCYIDYDIDEQGNLIFYKSDLHPSGKAPRQVLRLFCSNKR
ncbi:MAG: hypothetical protein IKX31_12105 [Muribaculaceae bacterium]|nr:hypothetical protein [Muribaculaceae bacterium]